MDILPQPALNLGEPALKICTKCKGSFPLSSYSKCARNRGGLYHYCRECQKSAHRAHYKRTGGRSARDSHLRGAYGVTSHEYDSMLDRQSGVCAICHQPETARHKSGVIKSLAVDHCHKTNRVRGLLCEECNHGLGRFRDSVERLQSAIKYLEADL